MDFIKTDNQTLIIITLLILFMMITILLIMRNEYWDIKGLGYAIWGNIFIVISNIFVYVNNISNVKSFSFLVSIFDLLGMTFLIVAIFVFFNEKVKRNMYIILNILNLLLTYYIFYLNPNVGFRRASFPLILVILCFDGALLMRKKHKQYKLISYNVIKYSLYFFIAFNFYRIIYRISVHLNFITIMKGSYSISFALMGMLFFFILITFSFALMTMDTLYNNVKQLSFRDPLTKIFNRRYLEEYLSNLMKDIKRNNKTFLIAIIDIDYFKKINDIYGHSMGDKFLIWFADLLKTNLRDNDITARYGGDEFIIIFNSTSLEDGHNTLQRVLNEARQTNWGRKKFNLSFSGSIMEVNHTHSYLDIFELIDEVDKKMYVAKKEGRDQVLIVQPDVISL